MTSAIQQLQKLFEDCDDHNEQEEIIQTAAEILWPQLLVGGPVSLEDGVSAVAQASVAAYRQAVGERVRKYRVQRKLTQEVLAEKTGLPQSHISRIEKGKHSSTHETIRRLAKALRVNLSELTPAGRKNSFV